MLRVWSDFLTAADRRQVTLLGLLDLSAAFDCVDHTILLQRLRSVFGPTDVVLQCIESFLSDRTQQVAFNGQLSVTQPVLFGVPQGSVLGPLLYVLYTAKLAKVVAGHGLQMHQYADEGEGVAGDRLSTNRLLRWLHLTDFLLHLTDNLTDTKSLLVS